MSQTFGEMAAKLEQGITSEEKEELMNKVVLTIAGNVMRVMPSKTGTARRSITQQVAAGGESGSVGTNLGYAEDIYYGTAPHIITPKNKKVLAFKAGTKQVFSKIVHHPGTKAVPFLDQGLDASMAAIDGILAESGLQMASRLAE